MKLYCVQGNEKMASTFSLGNYEKVTRAKFKIKRLGHLMPLVLSDYEEIHYLVLYPLQL